MLCLLVFGQSLAHADVLYDAARDRCIPLAISLPGGSIQCQPEAKCPVAFVSAGYGVSHNHYRFIAQELNLLGYLVVAIGHELPQDPPLEVTGHLFQTRSENWQRGAQTLRFVRSQMQPKYPGYDFDHLLLLGHSNGGDISSWLAAKQPPYVSTLITLDHRRVPLPRDHAIQVLSIRAGDFPADAGVLPSPAEQQQFPICLVRLAKAQHNQMEDDGPMWLKTTIQDLIRGYLTGTDCQQLQSATS